MIRLWLVFAILFAGFYFVIPAFRKMTGKEKWDLTKTLLFSLLCSLLAVGVMTAIVVLF
jgi:cytochrome c oxidase assembly factor CtaG